MTSARLDPIPELPHPPRREIGIGRAKVRPERLERPRAGPGALAGEAGLLVLTTAAVPLADGR